MKKAQREKFYNIGELARSVGITVRTLQYYDRQNLLHSTLNQSGRRMYSSEDIVKLQQILFLKSCGFSLDEIKSLTSNAIDSENLKSQFARQSKIIADQIRKLENISEVLNSVITEIKVSGNVNVDKVIVAMNLMQQGNPYAFMIRYFNSEHFYGILDNLFGSSEKLEEVKQLFELLILLYTEGKDPVGKEGQQLAERWWKMVVDFTNGDQEIIKMLLSVGKDVHNWPQETRASQEAVSNFLETALGHYFHSEGINLSE